MYELKSQGDELEPDVRYRILGTTFKDELFALQGKRIMKEKITGRVGRIIAGTLNALVDAVENAAPEVVMEEAIREIDDAIDEVRAELGTVIANKHLANSRLIQVNSKCGDLADKIDLAVNENRDDLAEAAIAQQLDYEAQIPVLENQISDLGSQEKELDGYIAALQGKKREMREDLRLFRESRKQVNQTGSPEAAAGSTPESKVDRAESAFDRVMEKSGGQAGRSAATDRENAKAMHELEDLARKNRIQERLAAIKKNKGTS